MLAALIAGTLLARRGELIGYFSSGGRQRSIVAGWLMCSGPWLLSGLLLAEYGLPYASRVLLELEVGEGQFEKITSERRSVEWLSLGSWRLHLSHISNQPDEFYRPELYEMQDGVLEAVWNARVLRYESGTWFLHDAERIGVNGTVTKLKQHSVDLEISAPDLWMVTAPPELLGREKLVHLVEKKQRIGADYLTHELMLYRRLGYPVVLIPLLLLIAPLALQPSRNRNVAEAFGIGVVSSGLVLGMEGGFRMLAMSRAINPIWGGWGLPITAFALLGGLVLFQKIRSVQRVRLSDNVDTAV